MSLPNSREEYWQQLQAHFFEELRAPTAHHEAGHFVLSVFVGDVSLKLHEEEKIDLIPKWDHGNWGVTRLHHRTSLKNRREALGRAVQLCGGHAAEARFNPSYAEALEIDVDEQLHGRGRGDFSSAAEALSEFFNSEDVPGAVRDALEHAHRLVEDPAVWKAVKHVATRLLELPLEKTVIRGEEIQSLKLNVSDRLLPAGDRLNPVPPLSASSD
jgi:hypothetical protein